MFVIYRGKQGCCLEKNGISIENIEYRERTTHTPTACAEQEGERRSCLGPEPTTNGNRAGCLRKGSPDGFYQAKGENGRGRVLGMSLISRL